MTDKEGSSAATNQGEGTGFEITNQRAMSTAVQRVFRWLLVPVHVIVWLAPIIVFMVAFYVLLAGLNAL